MTTLLSFMSVVITTSSLFNDILLVIYENVPGVQFNMLNGKSYFKNFLASNSSAGWKILWLRALCIPVDVFGQRYALSSKLRNKTFADLLPFSHSFLMIFSFCALQKSVSRLFESSAFGGFLQQNRPRPM